MVKKGRGTRPFLFTADFLQGLARNYIRHEERPNLQRWIRRDILLALGVKLRGLG